MVQSPTGKLDPWVSILGNKNHCYAGRPGILVILFSMIHQTSSLVNIKFLLLYKNVKFWFLLSSPNLELLDSHPVPISCLLKFKRKGIYAGLYIWSKLKEKVLFKAAEIATFTCNVDTRFPLVSNSLKNKGRVGPF